MSPAESHNEQRRDNDKCRHDAKVSEGLARIPNQDGDRPPNKTGANKRDGPLVIEPLNGPDNQTRLSLRHLTRPACLDPRFVAHCPLPLLPYRLVNDLVEAVVEDLAEGVVVTGLTSRDQRLQVAVV